MQTDLGSLKIKLYSKIKQKADVAAKLNEDTKEHIEKQDVAWERMLDWQMNEDRKNILTGTNKKRERPGLNENG